MGYINKCTNCNCLFPEWIFTYSCQNCDDGITENVRDIDYNGTGFCTCSQCKGIGEQSSIEREFCCEECMDEHHDKLFNYND